MGSSYTAMMMNSLDCYLVGEPSNRLLKRSVSDRDWVVVGSSAEEMISLGFLTVGKKFPVYLHLKRKKNML